MKLQAARTVGTRLAVATALIFGTVGLAACGDDDGGEIRNLNEETAPPSGTGSVGGSISGSGSASGAETASPGASVSGSGSEADAGSASASEASASPTP